MLFLSPEKDLVDIIGAIGPVLVAVGILWVACQQWKASKIIRRDIILRNYNMLAEAIPAVISNLDDISYSLTQLRLARDEADLCLSMTILNGLENILKNSLEIQSLTKQINTGSDNNRKILIDQNMTLKMKVNKDFLKLKKVYRKSLNID